MIYIDLLIGFLEVGLFSFGGGYAAIPLIRDVVTAHGWIDDEMLTYMIAVSESTPGPIMVNLATYVGSAKAGILGAVTATDRDHRKACLEFGQKQLCAGGARRSEAVHNRDNPGDRPWHGMAELRGENRDRS